MVEVTQEYKDWVNANIIYNLTDVVEVAMQNKVILEEEISHYCDEDRSCDEVYGWYLVSDSLAQELYAMEEFVCLDRNLWGRSMFGEMIYKDYPIRKAYENIMKFRGE